MMRIYFHLSHNLPTMAYSKIFTLAFMMVILAIQVPKADGGFAGCASCLLALAGEAAGACTITAGAYLACLLAAVGIKGLFWCAIPCVGQPF